MRITLSQTILPVPTAQGTTYVSVHLDPTTKMQREIHRYQPPAVKKPPRGAKTRQRRRTKKKESAGEDEKGEDEDAMEVIPT
jgi:hypothetical protein